MTWKESLAEIETVEFDVRLNVVSSLRLFLGAARKEPAVLALHKELQQSGDASEEILGRIYDLSRSPSDPAYCNPADTALTVLLWLLSLSQKAFAEVAASFVVAVDNCWYAKKVARLILQADQSGSAAEASGNAAAGELESWLDSQESYPSWLALDKPPATLGTWSVGAPETMTAGT